MSIKTPREPATQEDLRWWLTLAATLQWTWAVTYAESAPLVCRAGPHPGPGS